MARCSLEGERLGGSLGPGCVGGGAEDRLVTSLKLMSDFGVEPQGGLVLTGVAAMDAVDTGETRVHRESDR